VGSGLSGSDSCQKIGSNGSKAIFEGEKIENQVCAIQNLYKPQGGERLNCRVPLRSIIITMGKGKGQQREKKPISPEEPTSYDVTKERSNLAESTQTLCAALTDHNPSWQGIPRVPSDISMGDSRYHFKGALLCS